MVHFAGSALWKAWWIVRPLLYNNAEAFGAAWNYFFNPPAGPRNDLMLSYVYMALSIITSTDVALQLITYSRHRAKPSAMASGRLHLHQDSAGGVGVRDGLANLN